MGRRVMMGVHIHTCTNAMHPEVGRLVHGDTVEHMEEGWPTLCTRNHNDYMHSVCYHANRCPQTTPTLTLHIQPHSAGGHAPKVGSTTHVVTIVPSPHQG